MTLHKCTCSRNGIGYARFYPRFHTDFLLGIGVIEMKRFVASGAYDLVWTTFVDRVLGAAGRTGGN